MITLDPKETYKLPIKNGYLDISVSQDPDYPGLDIEYVDDKESEEFADDNIHTRPRVLIECPNETGNLRALIWSDTKSEDYNTRIEFETASDRLPEKDKVMTITQNIDAETILSAEDGKIRVDFVHIGEGYNGDYNPDDPDDAKLIRFDVYAKGIEGFDKNEWVDVDDASYCTTLTVDTPIEELVKKITVVFNEYRNVYDHIIAGGSVKKLGETLSWI